MGFQHPHQQQHKLKGMAAAAQSSNTPEHLRSHLAKKAGIMARVDNLHKPSSRVPKQQILRSNVTPDVSETGPQDPTPFETEGTDTSPMGSKMGATSKQPSPAGSRPMNVTANLPKRTGPGIVSSQGTVRNARPSASGLNQRLGGVVRPNASRRVPRVSNVVRKGERGPGIQKTATVAKTRNMRGPGANPNFYGDF